MCLDVGSIDIGSRHRFYYGIYRQSHLDQDEKKNKMYLME